MPGTTRSKNSRATEFHVIFGSVSNPLLLSQVMKANPYGTEIEMDGVLVEYGNISTLLPHLNPGNGVTPFMTVPKFAGHIDSIRIDRKRALERLYGLPAGSLTGATSRTDVLLIATDGRPYFLSVKDPSTAAKLGQVSTQYPQHL